MTPWSCFGHHFLKEHYWTRPVHLNSGDVAVAGRTTCRTRTLCSEESRAGAASMMILSPIFSVNRLIPPCDNCVTPPHSQPQRVVWPSLSVTSMLMNECGFLILNSATVPSNLTV